MLILHYGFKEVNILNPAIEIIRTILPVILTLALGMLCRKKCLISRAGIDALKTVAVQIGLPAVLLHTFAVTGYSAMELWVPLIMFAVCVLAWLLGKICGKFLRMPSRFIPFLTTGFEAGMLGYALFTLLYGSGRLAEFARVDLGQVLFVFTLYKLLLGREDGHAASPARLAGEMLQSPIIWSIVIGVLLGATGLYQAMIPSGAASVLDACTDFISAPVGVLILLSIGYDLVFENIPWRAALSAVALRLAVMAVLGAGVYLLFSALWPQIAWGSAVCLMFMLPPPYVLPVFSDNEESRTFLSSVLSLSTMAAIIGFIMLAVIGG